MQRPVTQRPGTNAGNIHECVNSSETVQAVSYAPPDCGFIPDIANSAPDIMQFVSEGVAFIFIHSKNKDRIFRCPHACHRRGNSR